MAKGTSSPDFVTPSFLRRPAASSTPCKRRKTSTHDEAQSVHQGSPNQQVSMFEKKCSPILKQEHSHSPLTKASHGFQKASDIYQNIDQGKRKTSTEDAPKYLKYLKEGKTVKKCEDATFKDSNNDDINYIDLTFDDDISDSECLRASQKESTLILYSEDLSDSECLEASQIVEQKPSESKKHKSKSKKRKKNDMNYGNCTTSYCDQTSSTTEDKTPLVIKRRQSRTSTSTTTPITCELPRTPLLTPITEPAIPMNEGNGSNNLVYWL